MSIEKKSLISQPKVTKTARVAGTTTANPLVSNKTAMKYDARLARKMDALHVVKAAKKR